VFSAVIIKKQSSVSSGMSGKTYVTVAECVCTILEPRC